MIKYEREHREFSGKQPKYDITMHNFTGSYEYSMGPSFWPGPVSFFFFSFFFLIIVYLLVQKSNLQ